MWRNQVLNYVHGNVVNYVMSEKNINFNITVGNDIRPRDFHVIEQRSP